jgi:hypothetical protein
VVFFRKINFNSIHLEVDGKHIIKPNDVADELSKHFQLLCNNHCPNVSFTLVSSSEFIHLASVSDFDVIKAIKHLRPSKSVGVNGIPGFTLKGCTDIFIPVLKHPSQRVITSMWWEGLVFPMIPRAMPAGA